MANVGTKSSMVFNKKWILVDILKQCYLNRVRGNLRFRGDLLRVPRSER